MKSPSCENENLIEIAIVFPGIAERVHWDLIERNRNKNIFTNDEISFLIFVSAVDQ